MTYPSTIPVGEDDLQAWLDQRLPPERLACVRAYLDAHPEAAARLEQIRAQQAALAAALQGKFDEPVPSRLRVAELLARRGRQRRAMLRRVAAMALLAGASGAGGWFARDLRAPPPPSQLNLATANAEAAFRTFVVDVRRPVEVRPGETPSFAQWMSNRLQRPLAPPDLASLGYQLLGGRVLPAVGTPAAQMMYDNGQGTRLTVYVQPMQVANEEFHYIARDDVRSVFWARDHLVLAVTGRASEAELLAVARLVQQRM